MCMKEDNPGPLYYMAELNCNVNSMLLYFLDDNVGLDKWKVNTNHYRCSSSWYSCVTYKSKSIYNPQMKAWS